ncbi:TPA: hypothetical protein ACFCN9_001402 [Neisseria gonorrhoeae]
MPPRRKCRLKGFRRHFLHKFHRFPSFPIHRNPETRHSRAGVHPGLSGFGFSDRFSLRWGF